MEEERFNAPNSKGLAFVVNIFRNGTADRVALFQFQKCLEWKNYPLRVQSLISYPNGFLFSLQSKVRECIVFRKELHSH